LLAVTRSWSQSRIGQNGRRATKFECSSN